MQAAEMMAGEAAERKREGNRAGGKEAGKGRPKVEPPKGVKPKREAQSTERAAKAVNAGKNQVEAMASVKKNAPESVAYLRGKLYREEKKLVPNAAGANQHSEVEGNSCPQPTTAEALAERFKTSPRTIKNDAKFFRAARRLGGPEATPFSFTKDPCRYAFPVQTTLDHAFSVCTDNASPITMSKDGRFYLRLTDEERQMLDVVAQALGLEGNASAAVRFMLREKHRELFPEGEPKKPAKARKR